MKKFFVVSVVIVITAFLFINDAVYAYDKLDCTFSVDKKVVNSVQDTFTLTWNTENADYVYINNGIGYVQKSGTITLNGLRSDIVYTLTVSNNDSIKNCSVFIEYKGTNSNINQRFDAAKPSCNISVVPESVSGTGNVMLLWETENASHAEINNGIGSVHKSGSKVVHVSKTTVFKMYVEGEGGSASCQAIVYKDNIQGIKMPKCNIDVIGKTKIKQGEYTTIKWNIKDAQEAILYEQNPINPNDIYKESAIAMKGEMNISPNKTTKYIIGATNKNGYTGFCEQVIEVEPNHFATSEQENIVSATYNTYDMYNYIHMYQDSNYYNGLNYSYDSSGSYNISNHIVSDYIKISQMPYTGVDGKYALLVYIMLLVVSIAGSLYAFRLAKIQNI